MDKILSTLNIDEIRRIVAGSFDFNKVPTDKQKGVAIMAAHCCLNGPVGTNKRTTFTLIEGTTSINEYLTFRVSNNSWKSFCADFSVDLKKFHPEICASSQQFQVAGDLWPIAKSISEVRIKASTSG